MPDWPNVNSDIDRTVERSSGIDEIGNIRRESGNDRHGPDDRRDPDFGIGGGSGEKFPSF